MNDDCDGQCDTDLPEWWCPRYKNRGRIDEFLGDSQPARVEVVAVRVAQWLNNCVSLDWCYESWFTTIVREVGPGFRIAYFLTAVYIVFVAPLLVEAPLLFQYDILHENSDMKFGDLTLAITFHLWTLDFALLALSYYLVRHHGTPSRPFENGECTPFYRIPTRKLRENRLKDPVTLYQQLMRGVFAAFFGMHFVLGVFAMHTILSHMFMKRNVWFAGLLVLQMIMAFFSSVDDLTNIGSP